MFLLCTLFAIFLYNILKFFPSHKIIDDTINYNFIKKKLNDNVTILDKLGYYNFNKNDIKTCFLLECMNYLLYCDNPNYTKTDFLVKCCNLDDKEITDFSNNFQNLCLQTHKNKMNFTVNEIMTFIKKSEIYKKLDQELSYKLKRSIILSKFINETTVEKLINALSIDELNLLSN